VPGDLISAEVQRLCVQVPPPPKDWISVTETAVIAAEPAAAWAVVQEPYLDPDSPDVPVACGLVPGTTVGQPGEIQYFVRRSAAGTLMASAAVVSELLDGMGVVAHSLRPPYDRMRYRVFPENGQAGVEITWTGPPGPGDASREWTAGYLRALVHHYKAALEGTAGPVA